jgi:hypothetical protein
VLDRAVFSNPGSPYLPLFAAAGAELGDVRAMVADRGVEATLEGLRDAGVYVTLDEFKGRVPLERGSVSVPVSEGDFDNPLISGHFYGATGGSGGTSRRVVVDLTRLERESAYQALLRAGFGYEGRPFGMWRVVPPSRAGLNNYLYQVKSGASVQRWFNPYRPPRGRESLQFALFTAYTLGVGRRYGGELRRPEACAPGEAGAVARWLAACRREGRPAVLDAQCGLAVRACRAARDEGLDVSGSSLRVGGEPLTPAKAELVESVGAEVGCHYSMTEVGRIGCGCSDPAATDDVHFMSDKLALVEGPTRVGFEQPAARSLALTTLQPTASKVMINVEVGDHAAVTTRRCGCPLGELGLDTHLHDIRSHEKLTTDGNTFLGSDVYALLDDHLPGRFGGSATDYQLAEEEDEAGLTVLTLVVSPRVGPLRDEEVVTEALAFLREPRPNRLMADFWAQSGSLRVARREPHVTSGGKIQPLHLTIR